MPSNLHKSSPAPGCRANLLILWPGFFLAVLFLTGCATFYHRTASVIDKISHGQFEQANRELEKNNRWARGNHRVLYYMNRGKVLFMLGNHQESNYFFNRADLYIEDYSANPALQALSLVSNPMALPYRPEDFEAIMVHYYKALNFIALGEMEGALVEARRINIRLQELNDKHRGHKNRYERDAFAHNLMGIIYMSTGDYNNAFIAFRNALDIYNTDYTSLFNIGPPVQLKRDLVATAKKTGFNQEAHFYQEKFNLEAPAATPGTGDLVFIWMNGMGPVKAEWSLNLTNMGGSQGVITFANNDLGYSFPIPLGNNISQQQQARLSDLSFIRVAFPRYVERPPLYYQARLIDQNQEYFPLELAQDINMIAFQSLRDRMIRDIGSGLLRLATKRAMEQVARVENKNLGTIVSIVNAMTERADTRNWQSLPYSLSYARVLLPEGEHQLTLEQQRFDGVVTNEQVNVTIKAGETTFKVFHQFSTR